MKPLVYKSAGVWMLAPTGVKNAGAVGSLTFGGITQIAKQCYNPK